ncbi:MAG: hypothetical protein RR252_07885 [Longicatena sp.]
MKFKIGDEVIRVKSEFNKMNTGDFGKILSIKKVTDEVDSLEIAGYGRGHSSKNFEIRKSTNEL